MSLIQIEKIQGNISRGFADLIWNSLKIVDEIELYSVKLPWAAEEYGAMIDNIHLDFQHDLLGFIIPYTDGETKCWECGGSRVLELKYNIKCGCMIWKSWCYNPKHLVRKLVDGDH